MQKVIVGILMALTIGFGTILVVRMSTKENLADIGTGENLISDRYIIFDDDPIIIEEIHREKILMMRYITNTLNKTNIIIKEKLIQIFESKFFQKSAPNQQKLYLVRKSLV